MFFNDSPSTARTNSRYWSSARERGYIDDTVDGFYLAGADEGLGGGKLAGPSFNIGSTEEVSMHDFSQKAWNKTVGTAGGGHRAGGNDSLAIQKRRASWCFRGLISAALGTSVPPQEERFAVLWLSCSATSCRSCSLHAVHSP